MEAHGPLKIRVLPGTFAVCRGASQEHAPPVPPAAEFWCWTRTRDETSLVCEEPLAPSAMRVEGGWRLLKLLGPFPFTATGILASVLNPLAEAGVGIFAISTFDTDYVLVKAAQLEIAREALRAAGHQVRDSADAPG